MGNTGSTVAQYNPATIATEKVTSLTNPNPAPISKPDALPLAPMTAPLALPAQPTTSNNIVEAQLNGVTGQVSGVSNQLTGVSSQLGNLNSNFNNGVGMLGGQIGSLSTQVGNVGTQLGSQITQVRGDIAQTGSYLSGQLGTATSTLSAGQGAIIGGLRDTTQLIGDATRFTAGEIGQLNDNLGNVQRSLTGSIDGAVNSLMWPIVIGGAVIGFMVLQQNNNRTQQ